MDPRFFGGGGGNNALALHQRRMIASPGEAVAERVD
jgi:hypothetical protein